MNALRQDVMIYLRAADAPMPAQCIAHAAGVSVGYVFDALSYLVRHDEAMRHRCNDGVVRYSACVVKRATVAPREITPHQMRPRLLRPRPAPRAEMVLAAMSLEPMHIHAIAAALDGRFSYTQVSNLLQTLKRRGAVTKCDGGTSNALWQRIADASPVVSTNKHDSTLPPNLAAAQHLPNDTDDELPPWLG